MNIIYDIYSMYLYNTDVDDFKYAVLNNNRDLGWSFSNCWNGDYFDMNALRDRFEIINIEKCISIIRKTEGSDSYSVIDGVKHKKNYAVYNIHWDETESGINVLEYKYLHYFHMKGEHVSSYSTIRICDHDKDFNITEKRQKLLRERKLKRIV